MKLNAFAEVVAARLGMPPRAGHRNVSASALFGRPMASLFVAAVTACGGAGGEAADRDASGVTTSTSTTGSTTGSSGGAAGSSGAPTRTCGNSEVIDGLEIKVGLSLSADSVSSGQTLTGTATLYNPTGAAIELRGVDIAARPPGGTNSGGPYDDLYDGAGVTVAAGQSYQVKGGRPITAADPTGNWYAYLTLEDASGTYHDSHCDVNFTVGAGGTKTPSDGGTHGGGTDAGTPSADAAVTPSSAINACTLPGKIATGPGYDGVIAINAAGALVNGAGDKIQLRGANMDGLDGQGMSGGWNDNPWGSMGDLGTSSCGPDWVAYSTWKPNAVRIPLNSQSFMGVSPATLTGSGVSSAAWGATYPADPNALYRPALQAAINNARAIGAYVILDLHWAAPQFTFHGVTDWLGAFGQPPFADYDSGMKFWEGLVTWLQDTYGKGNFNDILFELFNEPYFNNFQFTLTTLGGKTPPATPSSPGLSGSEGAEYVMLNGGYCNWFYQQGTTNGLGRGIPYGFTSPAGNPSGLSVSWEVAGYQSILTAIRALGATNVVLVNPNGYASIQSTLRYIYPTDTLDPPQVATGWHAYVDGQESYAAANIAGTGGVGHPVPVIITETGTRSGPGLPTDSYIQGLQNWADSVGAGFVIWNWTGAARYGEGSSESFVETIAGAPTTFTASITGNVLTVSSIDGTPINPGFLLTSGAAQGTYVVNQLTGSTGGAGTYRINVAQSVGSSQITGSMLIPWSGQGQTNYDWMVGPHPIP